MTETNRVVVRFADGRLLKGTTQDFFPNRPTFHLHPLGATSPQTIDCRMLKAVFFVREFAGDRHRRDIGGFGHVPLEMNQGKKIAVRFKDGEVIFGYALSYSTERDGFFVVPADPGSNNVRIYVMRKAAQKVLVGSQAEALANSANRDAA